MKRKTLRIFTSTPVDFNGSPVFFTRDSGLLCRGLQSLGVESRVVMTGNPRPDDEPDLIRTEYRNLESADWWKSHDLDGVVLYAWGSPKFRKVAEAIRKASIFLVLNQDSGGLVSPLAGPAGWIREQWNVSGGIPSFLKRFVRGLSVGLLATDPLRATHLRQGNVIACVSPTATERYRKLCGIYGGRSLAERVATVPHPVETRFHFAGGLKENRIICLGRWDDTVQKRPRLLMETIGSLLENDDTITVVIAGKTTGELTEWHNRLPSSQAKRVRLAGPVDRDALRSLLHGSRIFYSPSAFESFGIAAAEALCCGCSVVAERSVSMAAFDWFVSEESGTLAEKRGARAHVSALRSELAAWDCGKRQPERIARVWAERLHAPHVAARILEWRERFS